MPHTSRARRPAGPRGEGIPLSRGPEYLEEPQFSHIADVILYAAQLLLLLIEPKYAFYDPCHVFDVIIASFSPDGLSHSPVSVVQDVTAEESLPVIVESLRFRTVFSFLVEVNRTAGH
jgi:hypothetical protein